MKKLIIITVILFFNCSNSNDESLDNNVNIEGLYRIKTTIINSKDAQLTNCQKLESIEILPSIIKRIDYVEDATTSNCIDIPSEKSLSIDRLNKTITYEGVTYTYVLTSKTLSLSHSFNSPNAIGLIIVGNNSVTENYEKIY
jgi:hypothetical protein